MSDRLIRRDTPLAAGDKLEVRVSIVYTVDAADWLDGEPSVTPAEIEDGLRGCRAVCGSRGIVEGLTDHGYKGVFIEHELCPEQSDPGVRYEAEWEQKERTRWRGSDLHGFEQGYALVKPEQYEEVQA